MKVFAIFFLPTLVVALGEVGKKFERQLQGVCPSQLAAILACENSNRAACTGDDPYNAVCYPDRKYHYIVVYLCRAVHFLTNLV